MREIRPLVVGTVITSFSIAALMGIAALLGAGSFGDTEIRILLTTVVVGIESVALLCYLAVDGHRLAVVGWIGAAVSLVAAVTALTMVWGDELGDQWKLMVVAAIIAATLAQASLLIALVDGTGRDLPLLGTLAAASCVCLMLVNVVLTEDFVSDGYWRLFGVLAILDVLGTVVLIALGAFGRAVARSAPAAPAAAGAAAPAPAAAPAAAPAPAAPHLLGPAVRARLVAVARERGTTPDRLVDELLTTYAERK